MKKTFLLAFLLLSYVTGYSNTLTSTAILSSNYIYRGLSYYCSDCESSNPTLNSNPSSASGSPVIQLSLDYTHKNIGASLFTGPVDSYNYNTFIFEKDVEFDYLTYYMINYKDLSFTLNLNYYTFLKNKSNNVLEYAGSISYKKLKYEPSYTNDFSGTGTNSLYNKLTFKPNLTDAIYLNTHIGYAWYGEDYKVGTSNFYDYVAGIGYFIDGFGVDVFYTNTLYRTNIITHTKAKKDAAITISVSKTFTLLNK